jgi:hypothetical protein
MVKEREKQEVYSSRVLRVNYPTSFGPRADVLCIYPQSLGVIFAPPRGTLHLAHVTYLKAQARVDTNRGSIDQFLITDLEQVRLGHNPEFVDINFPQLLPKEQGVEQRYSVRYQFTQDSSVFEGIARRAAIRDIADFHRYKSPPDDSLRQESPGIEVLEKFVGLPPRLGGYALIDGKFGKQVFLGECLADLNLDFARWCITALTPDFLFAPERECELCYAGYKHTGYPFYFKATRGHLVRQIKVLRQERAEKGLETRYLRIAKNTEAGHPLFREQLKVALEACLEEGLVAFMPTRFLEPDEEVARLFRESQSTLLISLDTNSLCSGACLQGRTNDVRLRDGLWYLGQGVNAVPYVNVVATQEMGGPLYEGILKRALVDFPRTQLLPVRIRRKEHAGIIGGWKNTLGPRSVNLLGEEQGGYDATRDHQRLANWIHPSLSSLIGDNNGNVRMCHHCHGKVWCGKCFLPNERGVIREREPVVIVKDPENIRPRRKLVLENPIQGKIEGI